MFSKFLDPKNDFAFQKIFGSDINKDILISFVNAILGLSGIDQIENVMFLKPIQDPEISWQKQSIVDILCSDLSGKKIIIQLGVCRIPGFEKMAQCYAAAAYTSQDDLYGNVKGVVFIAIVDFIRFNQNKAFLSNHVTTTDMLTYEHNFSDLSFTYIELPKCNKRINELSNIVDKWIFFIQNAKKTSEQDLHHIIGKDKIIGKAYEVLNMFNWKKDDFLTYDGVEKCMDIYISSLKEAWNEGIEIGKQEGKRDLVKLLLEAGFDAQGLSLASGLSIIDIESLL